jgi:hypothetical protein
MEGLVASMPILPPTRCQVVSPGGLIRGKGLTQEES